jgi:hypothetical protein
LTISVFVVLLVFSPAMTGAIGLISTNFELRQQPIRQQPVDRLDMPWKYLATYFNGKCTIYA